MVGGIHDVIVVDSDQPFHDDPDTDRYLAAVSPDVVLELIRRLRAANKRIRDLSKRVESGR